MDSTTLKGSSWLECGNLDVHYNNTKILSNIKLNIHLRENTVVLGSNGSGKSTLVKTITKLKHPIYKDNCYMKLFGENKINIWDLRSKLGFVLTELDSRIKRRMTIDDVILSGYEGTMGILKNSITDINRKITLEQILNEFDLKDINKQYVNLSDGQRRRVLIARSVINKPMVLVLDEPTSMLDIKAFYTLLDLLSRLAKKGTTLFYTTNNVESIIKETKRIILLKEGVIVDDGTPNEVLTSEKISKLYNFNIEIKRVNGYWKIFPR